jgi:hypothetical protein
MSYENEYEDTIIDYVIDWSKLVSVKVTSEIKEASTSRDLVVKYKKKVANLRARNEKTQAKQTQVPEKLVDKLDRNQDKLEQAEHAYEKHMTNLDRLCSELIDQSWKDLYPLLVKLVSQEQKEITEKSLILSDLFKVINGLSEVGKHHGLVVEGHTPTERTFQSAAELEGEAPGEETAPAVETAVETEQKVFKDQVPTQKHANASHMAVQEDETSMTDQSDHLEPTKQEL